MTISILLFSDTNPTNIGGWQKGYFSVKPIKG